MGPLLRLNNAIYRQLDAFAFWLWDRHAVHIKWPVRVVCVLALALVIAGNMVEGGIGNWISVGIIVAVWGPISLLSDHTRYSKTKTKEMANVVSLIVRGMSITATLKVGLVVWFLVMDGLLLALSGPTPARLMGAGGDLLWAVWFWAIDTFIPMDPPKRKRKLILPKLKLPSITLPGVQPVGAGA